MEEGRAIGVEYYVLANDAEASLTLYEWLFNH